ncbi:MAG: hypothetical protein KF784_03085 [Fimbriimonadaceae bacterium]|nr:hypothetical protein [Fimbriimonadaceae bacterium]
MAACPQCQKSIPDWSEVCQFCGAKVVISNKAATTNPHARSKLGVPKKVMAIHMLGAAFWMLDGIRYTLNIMGFPNIGSTKMFAGMFLFVGLAAATLVVGFLLLVKVKVAQRAVKTIAWINIVLGILTFINPALFAVWTWWIILNLVFTVLQIVIGGYMIYAQGVIDLYDD